MRGARDLLTGSVGGRASVDEVSFDAGCCPSACELGASDLPGSEGPSGFGGTDSPRAGAIQHSSQ